MNPASKLRTVEIDYRADPRWTEFVSQHRDALIYHHPSWLSTLENEYGQKCRPLGCEDASGRLRAILPLFYTRGLPFRLGRSVSGARLSSLPRTPVAGPLALDDEAMSAILRHAVELVSSKPGLHLEIKTHLDRLNELVPELSRVSWRLTFVQELPEHVAGSPWEEFCEGLRLPRECGPCEDCRNLRFGNARKQHRVNWAVHKAVKLGLRVREAETAADVSQWYQLYLDAMRYHAFPPRPCRFFLNLWSTLRPLGQMTLLLAERDEGSATRLVAGSILLRFGQTVFYAFTGCAHEDFRFHPHDLIQLELIRDACKRGFRWYDFGEVSDKNESLAQFKGKWGTEARQMYRYYYPAYPAPSATNESRPSMWAAWVRRSWRSFPLKLTAVVGDQIHRYL